MLIRFNSFLTSLLASGSPLANEILLARKSGEHLHNLPKMRQRIIREIKQHYHAYEQFIRTGDKVLDIGTGPGLTAEHILKLKPNLDLIGLDVARPEIYPDFIPFQLYSGSTIPFADNEFDLSLVFYTLHHARNWVNLLHEASRVTSRNLLVIEEFDLPGEEENPELEKKALEAIGLNPNMYEAHLDQAELEAELAELGLEIIKKQTLPTASPQKIEKWLYVAQVVMS